MESGCLSRLPRPGRRTGVRLWPQKGLETNPSEASAERSTSDPDSWSLALLRKDLSKAKGRRIRLQVLQVLKDARRILYERRNLDSSIESG